MSEELMKALAEAKTEEQKKAVAEKFKDERKEFNDKDLEAVAGGQDYKYCPR